MSLHAEGSFALFGTFIHSISPSEIEILQDTLIVVDKKGRIALIHPHVELEDEQQPGEFLGSLINQPDFDFPLTWLDQDQFLVPGFIDTHVHAPQFSMRGLGHGLHILDWLDQITFPHEAKFVDKRYASHVYGSCVRMGLRQGITTASYFGSIHTEATKILADVCLKEGQRAFIGKTCMDNAQTNPEYYRENTEEAVAGTIEVVQHCQKIDRKGELVQPILTPRFAISCTPDSLTALGNLARVHENAYGVGKGILNQTHFCEAQQEIDATLKQYDKFACEADLYEHHGLLNSSSVLAHCTLLSDKDTTKIKRLDCGIAHCPISNVTVGGGFMAAPIRKLLSQGIAKIGLGTDSGGGFSCSIMDVMRQAVVVGNARETLSEGTEKRLGLEEVFYMATLGGARVLGMEDRVGSFEVGKEFDAIFVDMEDQGDDLRSWLGACAPVHTPTMDELAHGYGSEEYMNTVWQKWIMSGDDRNLRKVWVGGEVRKDTFQR